MGVGKIENIRTTVANDTWTSAVFRRRTQLNWLHVEYTSDAGAGTRQIVLEVLDQDGNVVTDMHAGSTQSASQVRHYSFLPGIYRETSFTDDEIQVPIPIRFIIAPNQRIKIYDSGGVDVNDSIIIDYQTEEV